MWLAILVFAISSSCRTKTSTSTGYSAQFKPIFDTVSWYFDSNRPKQGIRYLDSAYSKIPSPNLEDQFRRLGFHYVLSRQTLHNSKLAVIYADSMLTVAEQGSGEFYSRAYAEANFGKGDAYFDLQRYNDAYECYYQGFLMGKNFLNNQAMTDYTYRMGMIMYKQSHFQLAANYFKESYKFSLANKENFAAFYRRQELLDNIGLSYRHSGDLDSSVIYFDKALKYIDSQKDTYKKHGHDLDMARGVVYGNKAEADIRRKDYEHAKALLIKSININLQKYNDEQDAEYSEIKLAQIYHDTGQPDSMLIVLNDLRKQLDTVKNDDAETDWNRLMSDYHISRGDHVKAYEYLKKYSTLNDSGTKRSLRLSESNVTQQLANYENEYQIALLKSNNKLQQIYLYVAVGCGLMAIIIIIMVVRNWKRSAREIKTITRLNNQVSQQKQELELTLDELKQSSQEKDRILRTVAHDLRNPISGISSLTTVMATEDDYSEDQKQMLQLIKETSLDTIELINEILEATNHNETELQTQPVEINTLLANSVELMRFKAAEKEQEIKVEYLEEPVELLINREKIRRVIGNLISNAIKFSPQGKDICIKTTDKGDAIEIAFSDSGIGIPEKNQGKIFNMFTDAKRPGTNGEKSFGLGLSICWQIIEKHGGKIWFESREGEGTTFFISLKKTTA